MFENEDVDPAEVLDDLDVFDGLEPDPDDLEPPWDIDAWDDEPAASESVTSNGVRPPSWTVVRDLAQRDLARLTPADAVDWLVSLQSCQAWLAALEARVLVAAAGPVPQISEVTVSDLHRDDRVLQLSDVDVEEIAAALRIAPPSAHARVDAARDLVGPLAPLHRALLDGTVSVSHAAAISREAARLPGMLTGGVDDPVRTAQCTELLKRVLPFAATHTPGQSARKARGLVALIDAAGAERRRQAAKSAADVTVTDDIDGQSLLTARMDTLGAHAVLDVIRRLASDPRFEPGCDLSAGQRRVAALSTLVLEGCGQPEDGSVDEVVERARMTAQVSVVASLETVLGVSDAPAELRGSGPISAAAVRELLVDCSQNSTLLRLVTAPDGSLLDAGRTRYEISDAQRDFIAARDLTCRFPGCARRADRCQVDHAVAWDDGGPTDVANLGALCARHHNLKTFAGWELVAVEADGSVVWISPQGRRYFRRRPDLLPPEDAGDRDPPE